MCVIVCACACICMHLQGCAYLYTLVYMPSGAHVCMPEGTRMCTPACMGLRMHVCIMRECTCVHACMHASVHVLVCVHLCMHVCLCMSVLMRFLQWNEVNERKEALAFILCAKCNFGKITPPPCMILL